MSVAFYKTSFLTPRPYWIALKELGINLQLTSHLVKSAIMSLQIGHEGGLSRANSLGFNLLIAQETPDSVSEPCLALFRKSLLFFFSAFP